MHCPQKFRTVGFEIGLGNEIGTAGCSIQCRLVTGRLEVGHQSHDRELLVPDAEGYVELEALLVRAEIAVYALVLADRFNNSMGTIQDLLIAGGLIELARGVEILTAELRLGVERLVLTHIDVFHFFYVDLQKQVLEILDAAIMEHATGDLCLPCLQRTIDRGEHQ